MGKKSEKSRIITKVLSMMLVNVLLLHSANAQTVGTGISSTVENVDGGIQISGHIPNANSSNEATILVGEESNILYINQNSCNENGDYNFIFKMPIGTENGTYNYKVGSNTGNSTYNGVLQYNRNEPEETETYDLYPSKLQYPNGIDNIDSELFDDNNIIHPLKNDFENYALEAVETSNCLSLTEGSHNGKFALKIEQIENEIVLIQESGAFSLNQNTVGNPVISKTNIVELWIKPMYMAKEVSFYTKFGEDYILIKSDKNADGVFKIGEELSQGRWQKIELDLLKTDEEITGNISGLYLSANMGSEWFIDDIISSYREINDKSMDMSKFSNANVAIFDGALKFVKNESEAGYNANDNVVKAGIDINKKLYGISIDSSYETNHNLTNEDAASGNIIADIPFSSEQWIVNDTNYDTQIQGVSTKINALQKRSILPEGTNWSYQYNIPIDSENEKRIRFELFKVHYYSVNITDGTTTQYIGTQAYDENPSMWFDNDVTLNVYDNYSDYGEFRITAIEYEPTGNSASKEIMMKSNGIAKLDLGDIQTEDRVKLSMSVQAYVGIQAGTNMLRVSLLDENDDVYYYTYVEMQSNTTVQDLKTILPRIKRNSSLEIKNMAVDTYNEAYHEIRLISAKLTGIIDVDWNLDKKYAYCSKSQDVYFDSSNVPTNAELVSVSEYYNNENKYAVYHKTGNGVVNNSNQAVQYRLTNNSVIKLINLSNEPQHVFLDGIKKIIGYGENDILYQYSTYYQSYGTLEIPIDCEIMLLHVSSYTSINNPTSTNIPYYMVEGLKDIYAFSDDGYVVYYANYYDNRAIYKYDFRIKQYEKIINCNAQSLLASNDLSQLIIQNDDDEYRLYNDEYSDGLLLDEESNTFKYIFTPDNELIKLTVVRNSNTSYTFSVYKHTNTMWECITMQQNNVGFILNHDAGVSFDKTGTQMVVFYETTNSAQSIDLYKKFNGVWSKIKTLNGKTKIINNAFFSNDSNKIFYLANSSIYSLDLIIDTEKEIISQCQYIYNICEDGRLFIRKSDGIVYLMDPISNEVQKLFYNALSQNGNSITYSSANNIINFITTSNMVGRYNIVDTTSTEKYLLSFDGETTWYAFRDGRWILASQNSTPTIEEVKLNGMTAKQVNAIKPTDFVKVYADGSDVLTLSTAILMTSNSNKVTPVIKSISVKTIEDKSVDMLIGTQITKFNKEDYCTINSIFPVENYIKPAEGYYLIGLGNDWLYTYKNGNVVRLPYDAEELFGTPEENWIIIKQYGMTTQELRSIAADTLNEMLVNPENANSEFAVIYTVKTGDDTTKTYKPEIRIQGDKQYFEDKGLVMEISLNNGDKRIINTTDISKAEMEKFMSWLAARQTGKGDIFYQINTTNRKHFLNYFMITSVDVFDASTYYDSVQ